MKKSIVLVLMTMIIISLLISGCTTSETGGDNTGGFPGIMAPDFQLQTLDGEVVSLSDFKGKPVLLNFWAIRCAPCRLEMPLFQEIHEDPEWIEEELVILAVNDRESVNDIRQYMEENGFSFIVLLDMTGEVGFRYNILGLPTTFFIDKDGIIRDVAIGAFFNKAQIEQKLMTITE